MLWRQSEEPVPARREELQEARLCQKGKREKLDSLRVDAHRLERSCWPLGGFASRILALSRSQVKFVCILQSSGCSIQPSIFAVQLAPKAFEFNALIQTYGDAN